MKTKEQLSCKDRFVIGIAIFFGITHFLTLKQARAAFVGSLHPKPYGWYGWLKSRFTLYMFTATWERVHARWVALAKSEGIAKDTFFSPNCFYGDGVENPLKNRAVEKWLTFLTDATDKYQLNMISRLAWSYPSWTEPGTVASKLARARLEEFVEFLLKHACTYEALECAEHHIHEGNTDLIVLAKKRRVELGFQHKPIYNGLLVS